MKKIITLIFFLLIVKCFAFSQTNLQSDTSNINIRVPEKSKIDEYTADSEFQYYEDTENPVTIWQKIKYWLLRQFLKLFSNEGAAPVVRYILMTLLVVLIIIKLLNTNLKSLFFKSKQLIKIDYTVSEEDISTTNLDEKIENSIKQKQYRLATRYLFLKTLKILTENRIIEWKVNKTNRDFYIEMKSSKFTEKFRSLATSFEYIWYGNFDIQNDNFNNLLKQFQNFYSAIEKQ